ncbi:hypothetical protein DRQ29_04650 [bacterium]|nr:MAG: hypothetical protein DRQ29_04650 [bacterium]
MAMKGLLAVLLRIFSLFFLIFAIIAFFALFGLAQLLPVLNVLGGGISAIMSLIIGLFFFTISYTLCDILESQARIEKKLGE